MTPIKFFPKRHKNENNRSVRELQLSPDITDVVNEYFYDPVNAPDKHLATNILSRVLQVPLIRRVGFFLAAAREATADNSPESIHAKNIMLLFNQKMQLVNEKLEERNALKRTYPFSLSHKNTNLYVLTNGRLEIEYENGKKTILSTDLYSYGWQPYIDVFDYNQYFDILNAENLTTIFNHCMIDEGVTFSDMTVHVGVMTNEEGKNTLSYSTSKESFLFLISGAYSVVSVSGAEIPIDKVISKRDYRFNFPNGCNFNIQHEGDIPTMLLMLEIN